MTFRYGKDMVGAQQIKIWVYPRDEKGIMTSSDPYLEITLKFDAGITHQDIQAVAIRELTRNIEELKKAGIE